MHPIALLSLLDDNLNPAAAAGLAAFGITTWIFILVVVIFQIYLFWRIAEKAGYPGYASLLMLIPLVNLIAFIYFAFAEWPVQRRGG